MEWRIRERSSGDFVVERGISQDGGEPSPNGIGNTMPAFIVYESMSFDTKAQAKQYMMRQEARLMRACRLQAETT